MVLPALMHLVALVETVDGVGLGDAFFFVLGLDVFFFSGIWLTTV
jgi:hypothetical protein